ncbi:hypothetical protein ACFE04_012393 [Oxalis oulophora]
MAGTCRPITGHVIGHSSILQLFKAKRIGAPFSVRCEKVVEGPSCIYVGPVETASKETLEALYRQARDSYYSGTPLIVDDMFDRVELKLRSYGSKSVVKYPRCSIRRQSAYADAEEDTPQVITLACIWTLILGFGCSVCLMPVIYTIGRAYQDSLDSGFFLGIQESALQSIAVLNGFLFMALGSVLGYPIASASVKQLQCLWRSNLVALKGACPNCGEEVFAFVKLDQSKKSPHRADCHVCESVLEFQTEVEGSVSKLGKQWVYGRVYLVSRIGRGRLRK